jgi:hypothetical protein
MRILSLAVSACLLLLGGCSEGCGNDVIGVATSPDGAHDAVLFQRHCGATTGFSTQISVLPPGEKPSAAGTAFIADGHHGKAAATPWGGPGAELSWLAPGHLLVRYDQNSRVFKREDAAGVRITYQAMSPQALPR